jgi:hypothetical protein
MDAAKKSGLIYFILGVGLALLIWGVQLIGVVVNIFLGGIVLAIAFGLVVYAFWIWERPSTWHVLLRIGTIAIAAVIYFLLVGKQMVAEWHKENPVVATKSQEPIPPTSPVLSPQEPLVKKLPTKRTSKDQQQSGKDNIQTGPITQGPGSAMSFNQRGGITAGTYTVNSGSRYDALTSTQIDKLKTALSSKAPTTISFETRSAVADTQNYCGMLANIFRKSCDNTSGPPDGDDEGIIPIPAGVNVYSQDGKEELAQFFLEQLRANGVDAHLGPKRAKGAFNGDIKIFVGEPEKK